MSLLKKKTGTVIPWFCIIMRCPNSKVDEFTIKSANLSLHQSLLQLPLPDASFSSTHQVGVQILPSQKQLQFCRTHIIINTQQENILPYNQISINTRANFIRSESREQNLRGSLSKHTSTTSRLPKSFLYCIADYNPTMT